MDLGAAPPYEIAVEIAEEDLDKYHLTLEQVAQKIRSASLDLAGGTIRDPSGDVLIRTTEKRRYGGEYDSISVFTTPDGHEVLLRDLAHIKDGLSEVEQESILNGEPAVMLRIFRVGDQQPRAIAQKVRRYLERHSPALPPSIRVTVYRDWSQILQQRIDLLLKNGLLGLILVLITLTLFLEIRLAFWVAAGIAISFLGAMIFMPSLDVSINMLSLFGFLIMLGIVVDDAIVVGENIFVYRHRGDNLQTAAIKGVREMARPVIFAALTTVAAFAPLLAVGGFLGKFMGVVPKIVIAVLTISLVEALLVLPAHLSGRLSASRAPVWDRIEKFRSHFDKLVHWLINHTYSNTLNWAIRNRYTSLALAVFILLLTVGILGHGIIKFTFMPKIESDEVVVTLTMPPGTPYAETRRHIMRIQEMGRQVVLASDSTRRDGGSNLRFIYTMVGQTAVESGHMGNRAVFASNLGQVRIMLDDVDRRSINAGEVAARWRRAVGEIPGAEDLAFQSDMVRSGADLEIQLSHSDYNVLLEAVERLENTIAGYQGIKEVTDTYSEGKMELRLRLRPDAASLGLTERDLALQIRSAFFGAEALRILRGQNEVKVLVRYPKRARETVASLSRMRLRTRDGRSIPLFQAAYVDEGRGFNNIIRTDRRRVINVSARVDRREANTEEILADLQKGELKQLLTDYPGLSYDLEGSSRDRKEAMASLIQAFLFGILLIFGLLAVPFKSFLQPFIIMSAIPFGFVGAILGHLLLGYNISMISMWGFVALTGVVVNSSLVMIDFINRAREDGMPLHQAIMESGRRRFRPIIMTSLTTFFGLVPIILETSIQARFLIPMAISLGFGVLISTAITLVLIPVLYSILEDFIGWFGSTS